MGVRIAALPELEAEPVQERRRLVLGHNMRHDIAYEEFNANGMERHDDIGIVKDPVAALCHGFAGLWIEAIGGRFWHGHTRPLRHSRSVRCRRRR